MSDIKWCCEINASGEKAEMVGAVCFQKKGLITVLHLWLWIFSGDTCK